MAKEKTTTNATLIPVQKGALKDKMAEYIRCYPHNKTFYITTDGQVFLESNKNDAQNHQNYLGKSKELEVFEVK